MIISFFENLLGLSSSRHFSSPSPGLRLIAAGDPPDPPGVLLFAVRPARRPPEPEIRRWTAAHEAADRLRSCTESLGFESFDERGSESGEAEIAIERSRPSRRSRDRRVAGARARPWFPPPMERGCFLRPEKRDGRLLITEVRKIQRREVFHASREDGRLRLEFVRDRGDAAADHDFHQQQQQQVREREPRGEDRAVHQWTLGRCQELPRHHPLRHLPHWAKQRCVTIT